MSRSGLLVGASALAFMVVLGAVGAANAQTGGATDVEEVIVTGSFIAGTPKDTAIPVTVLTQADLERRGSPSVLDIIKNLPVIGPVLGDSNQFSVAAQGRSGGGNINLRGLGAQRTLVLMNGRRFTGYGSDTNLLPVAAIGRVEILKDKLAAENSPSLTQERIRVHRIMQMCEQVGSADAVNALRRLADQGPEEDLRAEAKASLARLKK